MKRYVFIISDGTGITAENLGSSLITQFENVEFDKVTIPYVDTAEKAEAVLNQVNICAKETKTKPLIFMTLVDVSILAILEKADAFFFDLFNTFLGPLEKALGIKSSFTVGRAHSVSDNQLYSHRIEAIDFALAHDDGIKIKGYEKADIILIGVSRCGKTPSCLYMALQFGILAANYPFTEDSLEELRLPDFLKPFKHKLFGLTIDADRLQHIRTERRPNSLYASLDQCRIEISEVEAMYVKEKIPFLNSTRCSIEEIATKILAITGIKRKI